MIQAARQATNGSPPEWFNGKKGTERQIRDEGCRVWSLDGAQGEALDEPPSNQQPDEDHRKNGDYANRHQFAPVKTGLGHQLSGSDRNSLRSGACERRGEGVVVPGKDKTKEGEGESSRSHQGHRDMKKGS